MDHTLQAIVRVAGVHPLAIRRTSSQVAARVIHVLWRGSGFRDQLTMTKSMVLKS